MVFEAAHFDQLAEEGYCVIENYLAPDTVRSLRSVSEKILWQGVGGTMPPSLFLESPELKAALFSEKFYEMVADLNNKVGPLLLYPNFTIRKGLVVGWHIDDRMLSVPVNKPGDFPAILMFNIYLQDNDPLKGGGMDIVQSSPLRSREEREDLVRHHEYTRHNTVMNKAGDLVIFDYRAVHRGTQPQVESDVERLALQWTFSVGDAVTQDYLRYLRARLTEKLHISDFTNHKANNFFADLPNISRELIEERCGRAVFTDGIGYRGLSDIVESATAGTGASGTGASGTGEQESR
ncbi:phytanoyl-CoA dioxygenase family protein [Streptomyces varsoviensis]|uniref:phytanoyl-CoA dioxygenase family protein n=1 Tax=Streptomyces varsoviensis TaxID=67373 RepID=UPI0006624F9D|nr:phytanoyl-CoA dioxygenase family protein [Streptomyces varsoviensis]